MKNKIWKIFHIFLLMLVIIPAAFSGAIIRANACVAPSDIIIDGVFSDWGTIEWPTSGVYFYQDASNNGLQDGSGIQKENDLNYFWTAMSTQDGGTEPVSSSNPIQNIYYRIDTKSTTYTSGQSYFIQLNLGIAPLNYADHCLQIWADITESPKVTLILYEFTSPYPEIRAYTYSDMTARVSNVSGYGYMDTGAAGGIGLYDGTQYSIEVCTPISWYGTNYGGNIEADGSGEPYITGNLFSSTGSLGSVGTVKDTLNNSNGYLINYSTDTVNGDTVFSPRLKLDFTTGGQTITAGEVSPVMTVQTQDRGGNPVDVIRDTRIYLTTSSPGGNFYSDKAGTIPVTYVTISAGTSSASFYYKDTLAGNPVITGAEWPDRGWSDATQEETVTHAPLDHFAFDNIADQARDVAFSITVTALDAYGNAVTSYNGSNTLSDGNGTINPTSTGGFADGVWTGEVAITSYYTGVAIMTSGGGREGISNNFEVTGDIKLRFTTGEQALTAGQVSSVLTVQVQNLDGDPVDVTSDTIIDLASSSAGGIFYSDAAGTAQISHLTINAGTSSASFYYKDTLAGIPTITGEESPVQGWSDAIQEETVTHGTLHHFAFNYIAGQTRDVAFNITITALDDYGNTVISYAGSNTISTSEGNGTINPLSTGGFTGGVWTGEVAITASYTSIAITTSGGGREGVSNAFEVKSVDVIIDPGQVISVRFEIINNASEAARAALQYQVPEELFVQSVSAKPYGIPSTIENGFNVNLGILEPGITATVSVTMVVNRDVMAETSLAGLLKPEYLVLDIKPVGTVEDTYSLNNLVLERSEEEYYSFIPFAKRAGERVEISVDVTRLASQKGGGYRINIIADDVLLHTLGDTFSGDPIKTAGYEVDLIINGRVWETREVEIDNGETKTVVFNLENFDTGEYKVNINGLEAEFVSSLSVNWWLIFTSILTVVFIGYIVKSYVL